MSERSTLAAVKRRGRAAMIALLDRAGLQIVRKGRAVIDLRDITREPVEAAYRAGLRAFLINVPTRHCRVLPGAGYPCTTDAGNPFVDTLLALADDTTLTYEASPLRQYYDGWQPATLPAVLGLDPNEVSADLAAAPPLALVMPWQNLTLHQAEARWTHFITRDNREHGTKADVASGWKGWGPLDGVIGGQEFRRLASIYGAITRNGYRRSDDADGDIKGFVLQGENQFRVMVTAGHHRASALAALGHEDMPVRIDNPVVRRLDVAHWPNVRSGLFTTEQGLAIFDRLFEGRQPPGCPGA
jgi:hypothetical protein